MFKAMFYDMLFAKPDNATTFIKQIDYFNKLTDTGTGGVLGIAILLVIGASLFGMMKAFSFDKALGVSMLITSFLGVMLGILGLVDNKTIYISLILLIFALFQLFKKSKEGEF